MTARRGFVALLIAGLVLLVVLLLTGVWLSFRYEPRGIFLGSNSEAIGQVRSHVDATRTLHRLAAFVLIPVLLAAAVIGCVGTSRSRRVAVAGLGAALVGVGVATAISGHRLAWSQIGIWATTPAHPLDLRGVWLGDPVVRVVIVGRRIVPVTRFRREAWIHMTLLPTLVLGAGVGLLVLVRRRQRPG